VLGVRAEGSMEGGSSEAGGTVSEEYWDFASGAMVAASA
jgi:hypothetical protein